LKRPQIVSNKSITFSLFCVTPLHYSCSYSSFPSNSIDKMRLLYLCLLLAVAFVSVSASKHDDTDEVRRIRSILFRNVSKDLDHPQLCLLGGGIASGKSTALRNLLPGWGFIPETDRVHLGLNRILVLLDGWNPSDNCASSRLQQHAMDLQDMFFDEATRSRTNVLYEGVLGDADQVSNMIEFAMARSFTVNVVGASTSTLTAAGRAVQQAHASGRWASLHHLVWSHVSFSQVFPTLILPGQVNCTMLFDTTVPAKPSLVLKDSDILMPALFSAFLHKTQDTEEAIRDQLGQPELDAYNNLCGCDEVHSRDTVLCGGGGDDSHHHDKSMKRWRTIAIIFISLTGLMMLGLFALGVRYNRLKRDLEDVQHPAATGYEPRAPSSYQRMPETA
jgi:hypothetical protein